MNPPDVLRCLLTRSLPRGKDVEYPLRILLPSFLPSLFQFERLHVSLPSSPESSMACTFFWYTSRRGPSRSSNELHPKRIFHHPAVQPAKQTCQSREIPHSESSCRQEGKWLEDLNSAPQRLTGDPSGTRIGLIQLMDHRMGNLIQDLTMNMF